MRVVVHCFPFSQINTNSTAMKEAHVAAGLPEGNIDETRVKHYSVAAALHDGLPRFACAKFCRFTHVLFSLAFASVGCELRASPAAPNGGADTALLASPCC